MKTFLVNQILKLFKLETLLALILFIFFMWLPIHMDVTMYSPQGTNKSAFGAAYLGFICIWFPEYLQLRQVRLNKGEYSERGWKIFGWVLYAAYILTFLYMKDIS